MHVSQIKSGMTRPFLLLSSLLLLHAAPPPPPPPPPTAAAFVPIGAGYSQDGIDFKTKPFGMFHQTNSDLDANDKHAFLTCGKPSLKYSNPGFNDQAMTIQVDCEPHPSRILVAKTAQPVAAFTRDMKKECEVLVCSNNGYPSGTDSTTSVAHPAAEKAELNVCKDKLPEYPQSTSVTQVFADEGECFSFDSNFEAKYATAEFSIVPRWLKTGEDTVNIRPFFSSGHKDKRAHRPPLVFEATTTLSKPFQECSIKCDSGEVVKVNMPVGEQYRSTIWVNSGCPSFRICFSPEEFESTTKVPSCYEGKEIDVLLDNGVVVWPGDLRASVIEFRTSQSDPAMPTIVEFGYNTNAEFYIGNIHREVVTSSVSFRPEDAYLLAFFFPKDDCLTKTSGIFSRQMDSARAMSSQTLSMPNPKYSGKLGLGNVTHDGDYENILTTLPPVIELFNSSTTPEPPKADGVGAAGMVAEDFFTNNLRSSAIYVSGKWWAWGIYIGFVIGTLLTLAIGGGLFYVLRRTVFGVWYRGMYKRYGCDASGTTGGITGIGFGTTATGTVTIQGTTGGGGTTAGTTGSSSTSGSSTMGGTTGGGTTGGGTTVTM